MQATVRMTCIRSIGRAATRNVESAQRSITKQTALARCCKTWSIFMQIITKNTRLKDAAEMLEMHMVPVSYGWEMVLCMMLHECDYITIEGTGRNAKLVKHFIEEGEKDEELKETDQKPEDNSIQERNELERVGA